MSMREFIIIQVEQDNIVHLSSGIVKNSIVLIVFIVSTINDSESN